MKEQKVKISQNSQGLHVRPAASFVKLAGKYPCEIKVKKGDIEVDGKSIMGLMMLALAPGEEIEIQANGDKEQEAIEAITELIEKEL